MTIISHIFFHCLTSGLTREARKRMRSKRRMEITSFTTTVPTTKKMMTSTTLISKRFGVCFILYFLAERHKYRSVCG